MHIHVHLHIYIYTVYIFTYISYIYVCVCVYVTCHICTRLHLAKIRSFGAPITTWLPWLLG